MPIDRLALASFLTKIKIFLANVLTRVSRSMPDGMRIYRAYNERHRLSVECGEGEIYKHALTLAFLIRACIYPGIKSAIFGIGEMKSNIHVYDTNIQYKQPKIITSIHFRDVRHFLYDNVDGSYFVKSRETATFSVEGLGKNNQQT